MTAQAQAEPVTNPASLPSLTLGPRELGDLELILSGAFAPLRGFMTRADVDSGEDVGDAGRRNALAGPGHP